MTDMKETEAWLLMASGEEVSPTYAAKLREAATALSTLSRELAEARAERDRIEVKRAELWRRRRKTLSKLYVAQAVYASLFESIAVICKALDTANIEIQAAKDFGGGFYADCVSAKTRDLYRRLAVEDRDRAPAADDDPS